MCTEKWVLKQIIFFLFCFIRKLCKDELYLQESNIKGSLYNLQKKV